MNKILKKIIKITTTLTILVIISYIFAILSCTSIMTVILCAFDPAYDMWNADTIPTSIGLKIVWDVATSSWIIIVTTIYSIIIAVFIYKN